MKILNPTVELWKQGQDIVAHVAKCARICYGKESNDDPDSDKRLYKALITNRHLSMLRHASYYAIIPENIKNAEIIDMIRSSEWCPYIDVAYYKGAWYIATNGNFMEDHYNERIYEIITNHLVDPTDFSKTPMGFNMMRYTFKVTTQISTSRELNRVSPNNIAEQSTRYVEVGTICRPHWLSDTAIEAYYVGAPEHVMQETEWLYLCSCEDSFKNYRNLIEKGLRKQDARGVLPLDTATHVIYTYSVEEWKRIIKFRSDIRAHRNAQEIACMINNELEKLGYDLK